MDAAMYLRHDGSGSDIQRQTLRMRAARMKLTIVVVYEDTPNTDFTNLEMLLNDLTINNKIVPWKHLILTDLNRLVHPRFDTREKRLNELVRIMAAIKEAGIIATSLY